MMHVIEVIFADGPHWYEGVRTKEMPGQPPLQFPSWSPYWEDRKEFNAQQAAVTFGVIGEQAGARIIPVNDAQKGDSRKILAGDEYMIRARYVQKGMIIRRTGVMYLVSDVTGRQIITYPYSGTYGEKRTGGAPQKIGKRSKEWVQVIGQVKEGGKA